MRKIARLAVSSALLGASALTATAVGASNASAAPSPASLCPDANIAMFGPNVCVFTPSMTQAAIQNDVNAIYAQQATNEMGAARYALLFEPGTYGSQSAPLDIPVGYYTEVDGLGQDPSDVVINGGVTAVGMNGSGALDIFWRSVSNLTIHVVPVAPGDCHTSNEMWAVSQAAPMRRVDVKDYTTFMPYCENPNYASGGFVADSKLEGGALNGSQQQFYVRNTDLGAGWSNYVWNQVFSGDINAPAQDFGGGAAYTTLAQTPVSREKPYLYIDGSGAWNMFVPSPQTNSTGPTWASGHTPGTSIPLSKFFIATPSDSVSTINNALSKGLNLLLTPGVYNVDSPIKVKRTDAVVQGLGFATLTAASGNSVLATADVPGIDVSGLIVDAGPVNSPVLMQIGTLIGNALAHKQPSDPTALQDVFFRVGGPHVGKATISLLVNTDNTILDDLWIWRADHGVPGSVGWTVNTADTGLVVTGDHVTATGLFVEHFQKYNVIWAGEHGEVIFFQNELPYDPPNQAAYEHDGVLGWAAFKVAGNVRTFHGYGMGSYIFTNVDPSIHVSHAFEVPVTPGVQMTDLLTINLSGPGTIDHVINDAGGPVSSANPDVASQVVSYP